MALEAQEVQNQEQDIRDTLQVVGAQISQRIEDVITLDWDILDAPRGEEVFGSLFEFREITVPPQTADHFALVDQSALFIGKKTSETTATAIVHSTQELLQLQKPPFPIDVQLNQESHDRWVERFPIPNTDLTLVLGTQEQDIFHLQTTHFAIHILSFFLIVIVIGGCLVFLLLKRLARPLNVLRMTMERVAEGLVYSRYVNQRWGFEINDIGQYFNETVDALLVHQKEAEEERIKKEKLEQELQLAREIQADLLPKIIPAAPHLDIGAAYLPALEVGGDFYDILPLTSGKILIVLADIADKGISACLFSLGLRSSIRALAEAMGNDLPQMVKKVHELFCLDAEETSQFATVWIGILDEKKLSFVSLGHPPALLKRNGQLQELTTGNIAIGLPNFEIPKAQQIELKSGDELLLYSDGATDAHDADRLLYGLDRIKQSFLRSTNIGAAESSHQILEEIQSFSQGIAQYDDLTLLVIRMI
jgi:sigma-B regulation protein RsbU (phosphoserine phosphatase)